MTSASGSDPLERRGKCTLILWVIQLMNDPGPEALADPTLIMLREPHLGGAGGDASLAEERRLRRRRSGARPARARLGRSETSPRLHGGHYSRDSESKIRG